MQTLFSILWGMGYLGNGILFLYIEWTYLRQNFYQIFNPFLHLQVLGTLLITPLFWFFLGMVVLGYYGMISIEKNRDKKRRHSEIKTGKAVSKPPQIGPGIPSSTPSPSETPDEIIYQPKSYSESILNPIPSADPPNQNSNPIPPLSENTNPNLYREAPNRKRPYLTYHFDEIEKLAYSEWNNIQLLTEIHYELGFRSRKKPKDFRKRIEDRLAQLQSLLPPNGSSSQDLPSGVFKRSEGLLSKCGYKVGESGLRESERRKILDSVFLQSLSFIDDPSYLREWGEPNTARRLQKLAESIAAFTRNAKRNNIRNYRKAIQDWESDLDYLKRTYYNRSFSFQWPSTGI
ncbi:hypothetical protein [Prochlorothrix hollandica]|uniref:hypothetical protein n=1 Tax=Prochlorothrix hollandica TaxID=1223 RepID=UPI00333EEB39